MPNAVAQTTYTIRNTKLRQRISLAKIKNPHIFYLKEAKKESAVHYHLHVAFSTSKSSHCHEISLGSRFYLYLAYILLVHLTVWIMNDHYRALIFG